MSTPAPCTVWRGTSPEAFAAFQGWLAAHPRPLLLTHERPDGDAFGSLAGLWLALKNRGLQPVAWLRRPLPERYRFLPLPADWATTGGPLPAAAVDGVCALDTSRGDRLDRPAGDDGSALPSFALDHHADHAPFADATLVAPETAATAQLVARFLRDAGWTVSADAATCLLAGLIMDTGGFRFDNTSPEVLRDAAWLADRGAAYGVCMDALFHREPIGRKRLAARILEQAQAACDGRFLYAVLEPAWFAELGVAPQDTEGLIDTLRTVAGVELCALIQPEPDHTRVSLRARSARCPADRIAHALGGGGHTLAAAAKIPGQTPAQVIPRLIELARAGLA
ncbi:MAG: DHH family phosphoesterase [Lentisphaeria bacterium]